MYEVAFDPVCLLGQFRLNPVHISRGAGVDERVDQVLRDGDPGHTAILLESNSTHRPVSSNRHVAHDVTSHVGVCVVHVNPVTVDTAKARTKSVGNRAARGRASDHVVADGDRRSRIGATLMKDACEGDASGICALDGDRTDLIAGDDVRGVVPADSGR